MLLRVTSAPPVLTEAVTWRRQRPTAASRTKPKNGGPSLALLLVSSPNHLPPARAATGRATQADDQRKRDQPVRRVMPDPHRVKYPLSRCAMATIEQIGTSQAKPGPQTLAGISRQVANDKPGNRAGDRRSRNPAIPIHSRTVRHRMIEQRPFADRRTVREQRPITVDGEIIDRRIDRSEVDSQNGNRLLLMRSHVPMPEYCWRHARRGTSTRR